MSVAATNRSATFKVILLDTDVTSFFIKRSSLAEAYFQHVEGQQVAVSFMTAAELYAWAEQAHWGERKRQRLEQLLIGQYQVVGFELGVCREWAKVTSEGRASGTNIAVQDAWVAATARYLDLTLVTHNRTHFEGVAGIRVVSEA